MKMTACLRARLSNHSRRIICQLSRDRKGAVIVKSFQLVSILCAVQR
jgi:hypothetical protein